MKNTKHSAEDIEQAVSLFFTVRQIMRTRLAQGKKLNPSSWLRIETLKFIADHDAPKMKEVADHLAITAPSATSLVNGLVHDGLVVAHTDAHDRRTSRLALTTKGKKELAAALKRGTHLLEELFSSLSGAELKNFTSALVRIKENGCSETE